MLSKRCADYTLVPLCSADWSDWMTGCRAVLSLQGDTAQLMMLLPCSHTTVMACTCVVNPIETVISPPAPKHVLPALALPSYNLPTIHHIFLSSHFTFRSAF